MATFPLRKSKAGDSTVAEIRAARYIGPERVRSDIILNVYTNASCMLLLFSQIVFPYSPRRSTGYALFAVSNKVETVDYYAR